MINPDAGNLGAKVGFVFFGLGVPFCVAFWFLVPETKGLSFEDVSYTAFLDPHSLRKTGANFISYQMDHLFAAKVPPRHFRREALRRRAEIREGTGSSDGEKQGYAQANASA